MFKHLNSQKLIHVAFVLALAFTSMAATCGKKEMVRTVSDAITSLTAGLEIAESAHRNGVMEAEAFKGTLETGLVANSVLSEVNEFASKFPEDGVRPTEDQKQFVLGRIEDALTRFDKLIENGTLIKDQTGQRKYLTRIRQARALAKGLAESIRKIEAAKPKQAQSARLPRLIRV